MARRRQLRTVINELRKIMSRIVDAESEQGSGTLRMSDAKRAIRLMDELIILCLKADEKYTSGPNLSRGNGRIRPC